MELDTIGWDGEQHHSTVKNSSPTYHTYTIKMQTPRGDEVINIELNTTNKTENEISNELALELNKVLRNTNMKARTTFTKPTKKLKLKYNESKKS